MKERAKGSTMLPAVHALDRRRVTAVSRVGWSIVCTTALLGCSAASSSGAPDSVGTVSAESEGVTLEHFRQDRRRHHRRDDDDRDAAAGPDATSADASSAPDAESDVGTDASVSDGATTDAVVADVSTASDAGQGTEDAGAPDVSAASDAEAGLEDANSGDAQQTTCVVPGIYSVPLTGTQCSTVFLNPNGATTCLATMSPLNTLAEIQIASVSDAGGLAATINADPFSVTVPLVSTSTGFTATGSIFLGGIIQCGETLTIDCQTDTISLDQSQGCVTGFGSGCAVFGGTACTLFGTITSQPTGGILASQSQSGSAPLFDAGSGDSGAGGD
jgi:hypothetical protein